MSIAAVSCSGRVLTIGSQIQIQSGSNKPFPNESFDFVAICRCAVTNQPWLEVSVGLRKKL